MLPQINSKNVFFSNRSKPIKRPAPITETVNEINNQRAVLCNIKLNKLLDAQSLLNTTNLKKIYFYDFEFLEALQALVCNSNIKCNPDEVTGLFNKFLERGIFPGEYFYDLYAYLVENISFDKLEHYLEYFFAPLPNQINGYSFFRLAVENREVHIVRKLLEYKPEAVDETSKLIDETSKLTRRLKPENRYRSIYRCSDFRYIPQKSITMISIQLLLLAGTAGFLFAGLHEGDPKQGFLVLAFLCLVSLGFTFGRECRQTEITELNKLESDVQTQIRKYLGANVGPDDLDSIYEELTRLHTKFTKQKNFIEQCVAAEQKPSAFERRNSYSSNAMLMANSDGIFSVERKDGMDGKFRVTVDISELEADTSSSYVPIPKAHNWLHFG